MKRKLYRLILLPSLLILGLSACGISIDVSKEKTPHYRTFADIDYNPNEDDSNVYIRKRYKTVMAEKTLFKGEKSTASLALGRHRDHKWMTGLFWQYQF